MCEFCHKHGEGRKWYLEAKNYSEDLLSDARRRKFIKGFFGEAGDFSDPTPQLEKMTKLPGFVRRVVTWNVNRKMKKIHYGQVLPLEDVEEVFGFVNSITRLSCICRKMTTGREQRYCYGISMAPQDGEFGKLLKEVNPSLLAGIEAGGVERLGKEEAIAAFREHEKDGLCHTVWTFVAPFIGGICNCDRSDCLAMRSTVTYGLPVMFRAEYVADSDLDLCSGCRACMRVCQFGAIGYSAGRRKAVIDPRRCYGCGICRTVCAKEAIALKPRISVAAAAGLW
ncbi:MAG: 4Fe-4S dicluster domain-containing protein [Candidatus Eisenbacteria bacterium]